MQLFYSNAINGNEILLQNEEAAHCSRVLRKKEGDILTVIDGEGGFYTAKLTKIAKETCILSIQTKVFFEKNAANLHIACAPTKNIERFEWFLEKATEIGIETVTPIVCFNSERRQIRNDRLDKIILSATKQSLKYWLPALAELTDFEVFLKKNTNFQGQKFIAHCHESEKTVFKIAYKSNQNALILIGPEGDFSKEEVEKAVAAGFQPISLGTQRLRTETAAIVATAAFSFLNQE